MRPIGGGQAVTPLQYNLPTEVTYANSERTRKTSTAVTHTQMADDLRVGAPRGMDMYATAVAQSSSTTALVHDGLPEQTMVCTALRTEQDMPVLTLDSLTFCSCTCAHTIVMRGLRVLLHRSRPREIRTNDETRLRLADQRRTSVNHDQVGSHWGRRKTVG